MAKGYDQYKNRQSAISAFGKDLTRRSGSKCELCDTAGKSLEIFEVPPVPEEPDYDKCIFICELCSEQLANPKSFDYDHWRSLNQKVWSEIPAIQVMAVRILRSISESQDWAQNILEEVYLDPEIEEWVETS